ncbi:MULTISPECIES: ABC transporter ATP-binding protein [Clostridia]|uniref:ABC transporter n=1 Tax=Lacrimispora celerecrescens TaxID=29354 RepID=A0A084JQN1_9FIRM|nr:MULTISPECIES: ABC transporter ATP-binding protein [Clostridia]KEZ91265.1 ABC transporter [Lacrimispora celerecrescens]MBW4846102.1 ABC transporter ATP-binding protein [Lachnospiraceae bacterium]MSS10055.1 ABC transporter ATP-binding protein [Clostridium sp. WB02_MRS01]
MLEIKDLRKKFGKFHALNGLDLHIPQGSLYGFVGPNGAGKTTTIKIMTGLLFADSGKVMIDGTDVSGGLNELKMKIGYVPDFFGVYDNLKVNEYMEFFASCYGIDGLKGRTRYMTLLEQVGLEDKVNFYVDSLSRGMKQRLCLARALIHDPLLLVLDEPTSGLDPRTRFEFKEILKELKEQGKTIFISSHVLSELSELCTDIGVIDQGKMILSGSMEEILRRVNATNPLIISVLGNKDKALTILKSQPCVQTIAVKDEDIRVNFIGDNQDEALLLQQLVDAEVLVHGFYREQGSLESLFMQITDHDKEKAVLVHEIESGL